MRTTRLPTEHVSVATTKDIEYYIKNAKSDFDTDTDDKRFRNKRFTCTSSTARNMNSTCKQEAS